MTKLRNLKKIRKKSLHQINYKIQKLYKKNHKFLTAKRKKIKNNNSNHKNYSRNQNKNKLLINPLQKKKKSLLLLNNNYKTMEFNFHLLQLYKRNNSLINYKKFMILQKLSI